MKYIFIIMLLFLFSCSGEKQTIKKSEIKKEVIVEKKVEEFKIDENFNFSKLPKNTKITGYVNIKELFKVKVLEKFIALKQKLNGNLNIDNLNYITFALTDYENKEGIIFFPNFDLSSIYLTPIAKENIDKYEVQILHEENQKKYGYLKIENNCLLANNSLIKDVIDVHYEKKEGLSKNIIDLFKSKLGEYKNSLVKFVLIPQETEFEYFKTIAKSYPIANAFLENIKSIIFNLTKNNEYLKFEIEIESKKEEINKMYELIQQQYDFISTNFTEKILPIINTVLVFKKEDITHIIDFVKSFKPEIKDNSIIITFEINENFNGYNDFLSIILLLSIDSVK